MVLAIVPLLVNSTLPFFKLPFLKTLQQSSFLRWTPGINVKTFILANFFVSLLGSVLKISLDVFFPLPQTSSVV